MIAEMLETIVKNGEYVKELEQKLEKCKEVLERNKLALDDWLNTFASEYCDPDRVAQAKSRIMQYGTVGYIAEIQQENRALLKEIADKLDELNGEDK